MKTKCEVYSRVVGYLRPVSQWNEGKAEEFKDRKNFEVAEKKTEEESISEDKEIKKTIQIPPQQEQIGQVIG